MTTRTFFTSDPHFGHVNILTYCNRPFADVAEMNAGLVELWNAQVNPEDTVYVLGDLAMGRLVETIPWAARLQGTKILILGNHDRAKPFTYLEDGGFEAVSTGETLTIGGRPVELSHYPFTGDSHDEDRYKDRRPQDRGQWLLCGHVHDAWRQRGRQINVGIDAWRGRLVPEDEIVALMSEGPQDRDSLDTWVLPSFYEDARARSVTAAR